MGTRRRESRKTVTVLFCDVVHSTGLAEGIDPEALRQVMSRYFEEMSAAVDAHGGTVEKFIGDEVMAVFGVPVVHEDDALRAVRAAADMHERLERLNTELEQAFGLSLQVRIGINTGEVMAGDPQGRHGFITGEPVVLAKRLEQAASPGDILIGKATYPLIKNAVTVGPLERFPAKGKRDHAERRRIDQIDPAADGVARRLDQPIIGRSHELHQLDHAFQQTIHEQRCRLLTLLGPAGIGKSRLAHELANTHHHHATAGKGRCLPYGNGITYWPLAEVIRDLGGEAALREALADDLEAVTIVGLILAAIGAAGEAGRSEETFWAVRRAFEALARTQPLLLILEDIHWAEPTFLDLIEYLAGWSQTTPILLLCLARPELLEHRPTWATPHDNTTTLTLNPLPPTDIDTLLEHLSGEANLDPGTRRRIALAAEGNPLFVEQFGALAAEVEPGHELPVPPSIQAVLAERLDRLAPEERTAIERAAVIGRDFSLRAVTGLSPPDEQAAIARQLLSLTRKDLIRPHTAHEGTEDRFRFAHVLIRDSAYDGMPKEYRAELHVRLAELTEQDDPRPELDELVGYHLEQAYVLRSQLGSPNEQTRSLGLRASGHLAAAGHRAFERADLPAAGTLLQRAAGLVPDDENARLPLSVELASVYSEVGEMARAEALAAECLTVATAAGDRRLEAYARLELAWCRLALTEPEPGVAVAAADEALEVLQELGDELGLANAWRVLGIVEWQRFRFGRAERAYRSSLEHALRAGARRRAAGLHSSLAGCLFFGPTPVDSGLQRCRELLASEAIDRSATAAVKSFLGSLESLRGSFGDARRLGAEAVAEYAELGLARRCADVRWYVASAEMLAGEPNAAERLLRTDPSRLDPTVGKSEFSTHATLLAEAIAAQSRREEALRLVRAAAEAALDTDVHTQVSWRRTEAAILTTLGDLDRADRLTAEAVERAEATDSPTLRGDAALARAAVLQATGRPGLAGASAADAVARYEEKGNIVALERARSFQAALKRDAPVRPGS